MKIPTLNNKKWVCRTAAFLFPFLGMLTIMLIGGYSPFGKLSMLYSDMYHQYFPFFKAFRQALLSGDNMLYNWSVGLGIDSLGIYSYYLASPLNLLSVLVPESWLLGYFSLLVPIKLGLASLFFNIFLEKLFDKSDLSTSAFGCFYGLCAWALGYQWNVMWLDTFALLPLVVLGMVRLCTHRKFVLYTLTLFLSVAINYYIGLFTCIFIFLVFICYQICRFRSIKVCLKDLVWIALCSALAIGMTAILSLPTLAALQTTQSSVNSFPQGFQLNMTSEDNWLGLFKTMVKVAGNVNGGIEPTFKEGLPNLYCGVLTILFAFLYLFCPRIHLRDKICAVLLLLFFNVSFIFRQLDYIWHGFHFTNMIPYRFSFLHSFVMLYMAYKAWLNRRYFHLWQVILATIASIGIALCSEHIDSLVYWAYNGAFILLYVTVLVYHCTFRPMHQDADEEAIAKYKKARLSRKQLCSLLIIALMVAELALNLVNFGLAFPPTNVSNYPNGKESTQDVIAYMKDLEKDNLFYRAEVTHTQSLNDGALNGYNGITTFTSSANVKVTEFMRALGYGAKNTYNRYSFEESSPVANLFLGIKYMIERDGAVEENPYFDDVYSNGKVHLLENNAYLPLGFLANSQLLNADFSASGDRFAFQNELMRLAAGLDEDVWYIMPGSTLTIYGKGPSITPRPSTGYCTYTSESDKDIVTYSYTANKEGLMCVNLDLSKRNNFSFWLNGKRLYSETYSIPQMLSVCQVRPGDVVEVQMKCKANENGTIKINAAILDEELFRQGNENLSSSPLELTSFHNTKIEGTIHCQQNGVLYTSIPQNGNWRAQVDGKDVEIVTIGDAMVGLLLTEGTHTIRFVYENPAFSFGWKVSLGFAIIFVGVYFVMYRPKFQPKRGKYEQH